MTFHGDDPTDGDDLLRLAQIPGNAVFALGGDDTLIGTANTEFLNGGDGNDIQKGKGGADQLQGEAGSDLLLGGGGADLIIDQTPSLIDSDDRDTLRGGVGNDTLSGGTGYNVINGGKGEDTVTFLDNIDIDVRLNAIGFQRTSFRSVDKLIDIENVYTQDQDDTVMGNDGANRIVAGGGADLIRGRGGDDALYGEDEFRSAKSFNDRIWGDGGNDSIWGGGGNDRLVGGTGRDSLEGGDGDDLLLGGPGADTLIAGASSREGDTLNGGFGPDLLIGSAAMGRRDESTGETFVFAAKNKNDRDVIQGFDPGYDTLTLRGQNYEPSIRDGDAVLNFKNGARLTLEGVTDLSFLEPDAAVDLNPAIVYGPGGPMDMAVNQSAATAMEAWALEAADSFFAATATTDTASARLMATLLRTGYDQIILVDQGDLDRIDTFAVQFPDIDFAIIGGTVDQPNVTSYPSTRRSGSDFGFDAVEDFLDRAATDDLGGTVFV